MNNFDIAFIGGGNMAASLIGGMVANGFPASQIRVSDPSSKRRDELKQLFGIITEANNGDAINDAAVVMLAVKPQVLQLVISDVAETLRDQQPLLISIAAGIQSKDIQSWVGADAAIVRTMPNTPALVQSGATGLYANAAVSEQQREQAESIMRAVGLTRWVNEEALMNSVTAVSGSGPAYYFLIMEAMEEAAIKLGLSAEDARLLTVQTAFGAAKMALESSDSPAILREKVTSPGGTTEQALKTLEAGGLRALFSDALTAAHDRSIELSSQLGNKN